MTEPEKTPEPALEIEPTPGAPEPEPAPVPPALDTDALAAAVTQKVMAEIDERYRQPAPTGGTPLEEIQRQAADPNHPLHAHAIAHMQSMRTAAETQEWSRLGVGPEHPARVAYYQNPRLYGGQPMLAFDSWYAGEARKRDADRDKTDKERADKEAKDSEARRAGAPGMPSRSVATDKPNRKKMTMAEYNARVASGEDGLIDESDKGEIDFVKG